MLNAAQIAARQKGLGGSDAGCIVGINPYRGCLGVWSRFHVPGWNDDEEETEASEAGNLFEDAIATRYAKLEGVELAKVEQTIVSPRFPFMIANPDRLIVGRPKGLEVKTTGLRVAHRWGDEETDTIPDEYRLQCDHYMAVLEVDEWDLTVCIGGQDFRTYRLKRDLEREELLIAAEQEFWNRYVVTGEQPPIAGPDAGEFVKRIYPRALFPDADTTPEMIEAAMEFAELREAAKQAEERKEDAATRLKAMLGQFAGFRWGEKGKVSWTNNKDGTAIGWEPIARELGASKELIEKYTTTKPGARVLCVTV